MIDDELQKRLATLEQKIDATYHSAEKTHKYLKWTFIISIIVIVLPLLGLIAVIPQFLSTFDAYKGLY
jgi:predicted ferric reductase